MPHVLVLEDDAATRRLLQKELTAAEFEVSIANDGLEGLMRLEAMTPDVIVCDLNMPNLDGIAFTRALKTKERTRQIPIIFLTANSDPKVMVEGINVGARFYMTKPFVMNELIWKIRRVLPESRSRAGAG